MRTDLTATRSRRPGEQDEIKSVGNSLTYKRDLRTLEDIRIGLMPLAESVASRLRAHGLRCRGVQVANQGPVPEND